jgi:hypothetical protein
MNIALRLSMMSEYDLVNGYVLNVNVMISSFLENRCPSHHVALKRLCHSIVVPSCHLDHQLLVHGVGDTLDAVHSGHDLVLFLLGHIHHHV